MNDTELNKPFILPVAVAVSMLGLFLFVLLGWNYYHDLNEQEAAGYIKAQAQAEQVVGDINAEMQTEMLLAQEMADKLSNGKTRTGH